MARGVEVVAVEHDPHAGLARLVERAKPPAHEIRQRVGTIVGPIQGNPAGAACANPLEQSVARAVRDEQRVSAGSLPRFIHSDNAAIAVE